MCRNIKTLFNFEPPATSEEIRAASLQFVRKVSGFNRPSKTNEPAFQAAVDEITEAATRFLNSLRTTAPAKRGREGESASDRKVQCLIGSEREHPASISTDLRM